MSRVDTKPVGRDAVSSDGEVMEPAELRSLLRLLEYSDRFRRDTSVGRIFHRGKVSFRETSATDSLHVVIDGGHVSAHVDRICPLDLDPASDAHYSWVGVLAHNASGMVGDAALFLGWRPRRCGVDCDVLEIEERSIAEVVAERVGGRGGEAGGARPEGPEPSHMPFGLVDQAVHLLDTEAAPWSIQLEVRVAGSFDEARLRAALARASRLTPWPGPARWPLAVRSVTTMGDPRHG